MEPEVRKVGLEDVSANIGRTVMVRGELSIKRNHGQIMFGVVHDGTREVSCLLQGTVAKQGQSVRLHRFPCLADIVCIPETKPDGSVTLLLARWSCLCRQVTEKGPAYFLLKYRFPHLISREMNHEESSVKTLRRSMNLIDMLFDSGSYSSDDMTTRYLNELRTWQLKHGNRYDLPGTEASTEENKPTSAPDGSDGDSPSSLHKRSPSVRAIREPLAKSKEASQFDYFDSPPFVHNEQDFYDLEDGPFATTSSSSDAKRVKPITGQSSSGIAVVPSDSPSKLMPLAVVLPTKRADNVRNVASRTAAWRLVAGMLPVYQILRLIVVCKAFTAVLDTPQLWRIICDRCGIEVVSDSLVTETSLNRILLSKSDAAHATSLASSGSQPPPPSSSLLSAATSTPRRLPVVTPPLPLPVASPAAALSPPIVETKSAGANLEPKPGPEPASSSTRAAAFVSIPVTATLQIRQVCAIPDASRAQDSLFFDDVALQVQLNTSDEHAVKDSTFAHLVFSPYDRANRRATGQTQQDEADQDKFFGLCRIHYKQVFECAVKLLIKRRWHLNECFSVLALWWLRYPDYRLGQFISVRLPHLSRLATVMQWHRCCMDLSRQLAQYSVRAGVAFGGGRPPFRIPMVLARALLCCYVEPCVTVADILRWRVLQCSHGRIWAPEDSSTLEKVQVHLSQLPDWAWDNVVSRALELQRQAGGPRDHQWRPPHTPTVTPTSSELEPDPDADSSKVYPLNVDPAS